jgi:hypothetical protein
MEDATTTEMSWSKQQEIITQLKNASNWFSGQPDAILVSSGGNDVAGDQFCIFLNDAPACLDAVRSSDVLGMIEASYSVLFALLDKYAAECTDFRPLLRLCGS